MSHLLTSSIYLLISGIGGGSIRACTSALSQTGEIFMIIYIDGLGELYMVSHVVNFQSAIRVLYGYSKNKTVGVV